MHNWNTTATWAKMVALTLKGALILLAGWIVISLCLWVLAVETAPQKSASQKSVTTLASQYLEKNKSLVLRQYEKTKDHMQQAYAEGKSFMRKTLHENKLLFHIGIGVLVLFIGRLVLNSADYISEKSSTVTDRLFIHIRRYFRRSPPSK